MKKVLIVIISVLLVLSIAASGLGYYYSINKNDNNKDENFNNLGNAVADEELKEYFDKIGKKYDKIYILKNTKLKDFNFDKETEKLWIIL